MKTVLISGVRKKDKPKVSLSIVRVEPSVWKDFNFAKYHYLSEELNKACKCFLIKIDGVPAGFFGMINQVGKGLPKHAYRSSRQVILPDFQGLGVSLKIREFIASVWCGGGDGYAFYTKTIHPRVGEAMTKSPNWSPTGYNGKERANVKDKKAKNRLSRKSYTFKYTGPTLSGYDDLMESVDVLRKRKKINNSLLLWD